MGSLPARVFEPGSLSPMSETSRFFIPLPRAAWRERMTLHAERVAAHADAFITRRSAREKHPVHDFLFTYYPFSPAKLRQWTPGLGEVLELDEGDLAAHPWLRSGFFALRDGLLRHDLGRLTMEVRERAMWIAGLCEAILNRPRNLRCHGMHEWAMVYRQPVEEIRHGGWRLRLPPEEVAAFVESQALCCTHYDAFRFFTVPARPMNAFQPSLESRPALEQGACLHANMDLYKWAHKLWPWTGGNLIGEAFLLALEGRELDMRASPYDLRALGCEPIPVETAAGRERYEREQQALAEKAQVLRVRLCDVARAIAEW